MDELPTFPLFRDPVTERVFERREVTCGVCGKRRAWVYTSGVYMQGEEPLVCPWCISDGSAATKLGCHFNDCYREGNLPGGALPRGDIDLVRCRTPGFTTWQDNPWMTCCGRACIYVGEATCERLRGPFASLRAFLRADVDLGWTDQEKEDWLDSMEWGGSPAVYVFECQVCGKLQCFWDCD